MATKIYEDGFNPGLMKLMCWSGVLFTLTWLSGAGPATGWIYLPPPSAADTATQTLSDYSGNIHMMRFGITLCMFSLVFYTIWGTVVSLLVKKVERDYPILFYVQLISLAACIVVILMIAFFWGTAAFRPGEAPAGVTQVMNDLGWLGVLYTGAPFGAYQIALGLVILQDKSDQPVFPRWSAFANFFTSFFMFEAALILFFKTGPFSQNGAAVFYLPMVVFFVWILMFSWLSARAVDAEVRRRKGVIEDDCTDGGLAGVRGVSS